MIPARAMEELTAIADQQQADLRRLAEAQAAALEKARRY